MNNHRQPHLQQADVSRSIILSLPVVKQFIVLCRKAKSAIVKMLQQYFANLANVVKVGYKSNAFAPIVWFNAVVQPFLYIGVFCIPLEPIKYMLVVGSLIIMGFSAAMYLKIFNKDPKLLQSERFRIEDKKLDLIAQKGSDITISPVSLTTPPTQIGEGGQYE